MLIRDFPFKVCSSEIFNFKNIKAIFKTNKKFQHQDILSSTSRKIPKTRTLWSGILKLHFPELSQKGPDGQLVSSSTAEVQAVTHKLTCCVLPTVTVALLKVVFRSKWFQMHLSGKA